MSRTVTDPMISMSANIYSKNDHKITIGRGSVVHPMATINAKNGPIIIGEHNIIEEKATIINSNSDGSPLIIGDDNLFEVGCDVRARAIGSLEFWRVGFLRVTFFWFS